MPKPYSLDLRARILKDYDSGVPVEDLVAHYEVSRSWTYAKRRYARSRIFGTNSENSATYSRQKSAKITSKMQDTKNPKESRQNRDTL